MTAVVVARVMLAVGFVALAAAAVWRWRGAGRDIEGDTDGPGLPRVVYAPDPTSRPCCDECMHLSFSPCLMCGTADAACRAMIWPDGLSARDLHLVEQARSTPPDDDGDDAA